MRESEYSKTLDSSFKKFLNQKRSSQTVDEQNASRSGALLGEDLADDVREYVYVSFYICLVSIHL